MDENLIELLSEINSKNSFISKKSILDLHKKTKIPISQIYGVATFYSRFNTSKSGKIILEVCEGTACHINKSSEIKRAIKDLLNIDVNQTSKDKEFTLREVRCLGACSIAPVLRVNNKIYGNLDYKKTKELLKLILQNKE